MSPRQETPKILIVDLASERAGDPQTAWISAAQSPDDVLQAINDFLRQSSFGGAEGWEIRSAKGFGEIELRPVEDLESVTMLASLIDTIGPIVVTVLKDRFSGDLDKVAELDRLFDEAYLGEHSTMEEVGRAMAERLDMDVDDAIEPYVAWDSFAADAEHEGHISCIEEGGRIHAFLETV